MFRLRLLQAATQLSTGNALTRGTATYSFRTYGDADGPNYHIVQHLTKGVLPPISASEADTYLF
jgi:hypothetical protein